MTMTQAWLHSLGWVVIAVAGVWSVRYLNLLFDRWFLNKEK
jgi:hypothetical protein